MHPRCGGVLHIGTVEDFDHDKVVDVRERIQVLREVSWLEAIMADLQRKTPNEMRVTGVVMQDRSKPDQSVTVDGLSRSLGES